MLSKWFQSSRLNTLIRNRLNDPAGKGLVHTLISGIIAAVSGLFLARLLGAVIQALIVRRMGQELYGEYATLIVSLSLFSSLLGLGLDTWLLQEGGRAPNSLAQHMREVLAIKVIAALCLLAILAFVWSNQIMNSAAFVVGAIAIIFDNFAQTGYSALRALRRNTLVAVFQTATPLLLLIVLFALERAALNVFLLLSIQASCSVVLTLIVLTRVWRIHHHTNVTRLDLVYVVKKGWLFVAAEGLSNIYTQAGPAILGATVSTIAVGLYSPARNLIALTLLVPNLMFTVGLPLLMAPTTPPSEYWRVIRTMLVVSIAYGIAALVGLWLFGSLLIRIVYGNEYNNTLPLVHIMSIVPLFKACSFVAVAIMLSHLEQRIRVILQAITVVVTLLTGWLIIPRYGATGTAWMSVGIELLLCVLYSLGAWYVLRRGTR